ncbi:NUDIX hydrolase [Thiofilum flexile]|uniref:NUDIX hydrolase n=1 Tax=Thiofilum flexile TaxID=125627 RepID=UPI0003773476|nr:CoA pyrophosphatase [Thiofilum flexile]
MSVWNQLSPDMIARCLLKAGTITSDLPPEHLQHLQHREAGVLLPLVRAQQAWHILMIRRTASEHDYHSGQVAFPGGKKEPSDTSITATALRETYEEIGLPPQEVSILGQLPSHYSISAYRITPTIGVAAWPYDLVLAPDEVARAFTIPLAWLAQPEHYELRHRTLPSGHTVPVAYFNTYDNELLWGATAKMVLSFIQVLKDNCPLLSNEH